MKYSASLGRDGRRRGREQRFDRAVGRRRPAHELLGQPAVPRRHRRRAQGNATAAPARSATKTRRSPSRSNVSGSTRKCSVGSPCVASHSCSTRRSAGSAHTSAAGRSTTVTPCYARGSPGRAVNSARAIVARERVRAPDRLCAETHACVLRAVMEQRFEACLRAEVTHAARRASPHPARTPQGLGEPVGRADRRAPTTRTRACVAYPTSASPPPKTRE